MSLLLRALALAVLMPFLAAPPAATPTSDDRFLGALPWALPDDATPMVVHAVVDGDTVRLTAPGDDWWEPYRIIGIQAPETDGPYTDEECYGPEAKAFLAELLPRGSTVYVQRDISNTDRNGRFLRHLFILDEATGGAYLVAEVLVLGGYARARSYPPDDLYDDILAGAQKTADRDNVGLWAACAA